MHERRKGNTELKSDKEPFTQGLLVIKSYSYTMAHWYSKSNTICGRSRHCFLLNSLPSVTSLIFKKATTAGTWVSLLWVVVEVLCQTFHQTKETLFFRTYVQI